MGIRNQTLDRIKMCFFVPLKRFNYVNATDHRSRLSITEIIKPKTCVMKRIFLLIALVAGFSFSYSQDKIYRNNGKVVEAKILEIGTDEIKYKEFNNQDGPVYILETDKIKKIVFANGTSQKFQDSYKDPERYAGQLNKAIKLNFLSPLYGYTEIGFEKSTGVGKGF